MHGEIELAKIELKSTVKNLGTGAIGFVAAAAIGIFSLVFFFIGLAELLAWLWFWRWAAYGVVFVFMLLRRGRVGLVPRREEGQEDPRARTHDRNDQVDRRRTAPPASAGVSSAVATGARPG